MHLKTHIAFDFDFYFSILGFVFNEIELRFSFFYTLEKVFKATYFDNLMKCFMTRKYAVVVAIFVIHRQKARLFFQVSDVFYHSSGNYRVC